LVLLYLFLNTLLAIIDVGFSGDIANVKEAASMKGRVVQVLAGIIATIGVITLAAVFPRTNRPLVTIQPWVIRWRRAKAPVCPTGLGM
jgi:hypothetical protein